MPAVFVVRVYEQAMATVPDVPAEAEVPPALVAVIVYEYVPPKERPVSDMAKPAPLYMGEPLL